MMLYEWEGKELMQRYGIPTPRGLSIFCVQDVGTALSHIGTSDVMVKVQVQGGGRGKGGGVKRARTPKQAEDACRELLSVPFQGKLVAGLLVEEHLEIRKEMYLAFTYDTASRSPVCLYSARGGVDIEEISDTDLKRVMLDIRQDAVDLDVPFVQEAWCAFKESDARLLEINPLVETASGMFVAADAKVILDDDAAFRHAEWSSYASRSPLGRSLTSREIAAEQIDTGSEYYRGTAGKYIEMDGDIAVLFSGGGASIANMDALIRAGLRPANYTEYSGNPPREKVYELTKVVLSKPGLKGLWIVGGVANFTNIDETFHGIADALTEVKPSYPIVVRRAGPHEQEGMARMRACALTHGLNIQLFSKEVSMTHTAHVLSEMVQRVPTLVC
ncbi:hypothetical protein A3B32_01540 [Candidatus Uhrbacteria bacterium RIFCSPLOWO2_01_FULL_53_9]|uniref:ATP-grasp domain-containing protein n=3 Tax=Candidatus Uhriibacteriota TaxID=1752732 RepID=A0A1F7UYW7_9BACT|nr:MAG: hypothetical protein A3C17_03300 [Candidatus Uhrbacteria bacterium RIFCSPHIGHO2_02_FULL_53_13]OGL83472.1 MAG: hypothetical protein A3B32_01540 [Candidatus Uhrbacteria bacterium RIFCSPLOWO2_01_FULL_53_9]OGL89738.1 MAG: hypothetical protein A3I45_03910 [Candidatus Uhrbacteria bacterium RIFCSPLOWO2_02_FULL_53_10]